MKRRLRVAHVLGWGVVALRPNNYQASPSQERRSPPGGRRQKPKHRNSSATGEVKLRRVLLRCRLRFQRWRNLGEDAAPNTY